MAGSGSTGAEVAQRSLFNDDELREVTTATDAAQLLAERGVQAEDFSTEYGSGFDVLPTDQKVQLIGKPFVVLEWRFSDGDNGAFVSALIVTDDNRKLVINDGSTGILEQLRGVTAKRESDGHSAPQAGLIVKKGLRVSRYTYTDSDGKERPAETFYLAN